MSPGLVALPEIRFSVEGIMPTRWTGSFNCAAAWKIPSTSAAPHMSYFISSMRSAGLMEIPPLSKVRPLPTKVIAGFFLKAACLPAGRYSKTMKRGGSSLPWATPINRPIFSFSISLGSKILQENLYCLAKSSACLARWLGVIRLPGWLAKDRDWLAACPIKAPASRAFCSFLDLFLTTKSIIVSFAFFFSFLYSLNS